MRLDLLNLGAGVQSSVMLLMSCRGELPKLDGAIFADTGWEPSAVYTHLNWLRKQASKAGIPVYVVSNGNIRSDALDEERRWASMPLRVLNNKGDEGMLRRQCTREYKIEPIRRFVRTELLGIKRGARVPSGVECRQWFGITVDEAHRMRQSGEHWRTNVYPFIGIPESMLGRAYTRSACEAWFRKRYDRPLVKSACLGCPYHTDAEWRRLKNNSPDEFADVVQFDKQIRRMNRTGSEAFLHKSLKPLDEVGFSEDVDRGQSLLFGEECDGMCGV